MKFDQVHLDTLADGRMEIRSPADQPKFFLAWTRAVQVGKINMNYEKSLKA